MKKGVNMGKIEVVKWQEGANLKSLSRETIFNAIQQIDKAVFHENGLASQQSDIDRYEAYKDSYIFALHGGKIIGYLCYFPITRGFYNSVVEGLNVYDGDIESGDICGLNDNANYIFLLSVAILPEYQKKGISKRFSEILIEDFSKIKIKDIVSYAFTTGGEHFLKILGLQKVKDMEDGIKLMRSLFQNDK
jgi:GNAT superfamily N-acetyltransferase